jgi:hypothetical protein
MSEEKRKTILLSRQLMANMFEETFNPEFIQSVRENLEFFNPKPQADPSEDEFRAVLAEARQKRGQQ